MKKNEKIAVITHGVPNFISEGASKEPIILIKSFLKKKINVKLFILFEDDDFSSPLKQKKHLTFLRNINIKYELINLKKNTFISSFIKILKPSVQNFYYKSISELNLTQALSKYKPDAVFNFYNVPMSISSRLKSKYKMYGYFTIPPHITENVRRLNFTKEMNFKNFILFIYSKLYSISIKRIYDQMYKGYRIYFLSAPDQYNFYKQYSKNIKSYNNISIDDIKKFKPIKKKNYFTFIMVGNLKATFTREGMHVLADEIIDKLNLLRKKYKFQLRIIGHHKLPKKLHSKLNYNWVKFTGWVKNISEEYKIADAILLTNKTPCGTRMRIINCMSVGIPAITFKSNIAFNKEFKNNKNILSTDSTSEYINLIQKFMNNKLLRERLSKNAKRTIKIHYDAQKIACKIRDDVLLDLRS